MGLDLAAIVRTLEAIAARHPDTAAELDPVIQALTGPEEATIGVEQARKLLGLGSVKTLTRWIELGILAGRWDEGAGRWRILLAEALRLRRYQEALTALEGDELTPEELALVSDTSPGTFPWQRDP